MRSGKAGHYLWAYYKKKLALFFDSLSKSLSFHEEELHRLRVTIKKIRNTLYVLEIVSDKKIRSKDLASVFHPLFCSAGGIREIQMNRNCITRFEPNQSRLKLYLEFLTRVENKRKSRFYKLSSGIDFGKFKLVSKQVRKACHQIITDKTIRRSSNFIIRESRAIKKLLGKTSIDTEAFHSIRKKLKTLVIITQFLFKLNPTTGLAKLLDKLGKIESLIGNWHDQIVLLDSLRQFLSKKQNYLDQSNYYNSLQKKIEARNLIYLVKLSNEVRKLV